MRNGNDYWLCVTCAVQTGVAACDAHPSTCPICEDERQYVGAEQRWTTPTEISKSHKNVVELEEPRLLGIGLNPPVGIGQRSLLVQTSEGNVLWDCIPLLDPDAKEAIRKAGGIRAIALSHPHFLAACVDISDEFDAPIYMSEKDKQWAARSSCSFKFFSGNECNLFGGARIVRVGGHFPGSSILHWTGHDGKGVIATGDTVQFVPDEGYVSFMYSYPNLIPLPASQVEHMKSILEPLQFERMYAGWFGKAIKEGAHAAVMRSADRYIGILKGTIKREYF